MPISNFSELEILKIAKGIEEAGYDFYKKASEKFDDEDVKKMFEYLAAEEMEHKNTFQNLYDRVAEKLEKQEEAQSLYDEPTTEYLKAISETAIFNTNGLTSNKVENIHSVKDALIIGLQAEKDSILFYEAIVKNTKFEMTKLVLERLIKEEVKHLHKFKRLIDGLEK
ncbi:ferritin family protein [Crassaminicella profunda]|uniref:ferritin family protein n=1 Tax=Crassaminicella profunda TaxID=1286698 RepID=UPI001CA72D0E|nr:ferritin family protein [Crassaminicella profunda]QZY55129.1 ferritin family protein [Crassaminicella profunda]